MRENEREPLLTVQQVADRLGVKVHWVYQHANGRYWPPLAKVKLGKAIRFKPRDVDRFIEEQTQTMRDGKPLR